MDPFHPSALFQHPIFILSFKLFILFYFFYDKISQAPKALKSTKKHQKAPKSTKKHQNALESTTNLRFINLKFIDTRFIDSNKFIKFKNI